MKSNLLVLCADYPVRDKTAEANLLSVQLLALEKKFENIYLLPTAYINNKPIIAGSKYMLVPDFRKFRFKIFRNLFNFRRYLLNDVRESNYNVNFLIQLIRTTSIYLKSILLYTYLDDIFSKKKFNHQSVILYSFWFDDYSLGASLFKKKNNNLKLIIGAHGKDLFEERHVGLRISFRKENLKIIDKVLVCSKEGEIYLYNKYPSFKPKIKLLNTGIYDKGFLAKYSTDGKFRILTLSRTHPVKRLDYLLKVLRDIEDFSEFDIEYFHIGGGQELNKLIKLKESLIFNRFKINFLGKISEVDKETIFKQNNIDVFLNVSKSEGTSVSVVEALNYSIPVILTKVGGNIRIGEFCKTSIKTDFKSKDLYCFFKKIYFDKSYRKKLRKLSRQYWSKFHNQKNIEKDILNSFK